VHLMTDQTVPGQIRDDQIGNDRSKPDQLDLPIEIERLEIEFRPSEAEAHKPLVGLRLSFFGRWLHEPLVHFLLAGILLFAAASLIERSGTKSAGATRIEVSAPEIQRLRDVWMRQWGRAPDSKEMQNLIDEYVHEEVLYREAIASGLDKDDTIVRRRLVEKMEFLSQEFAAKSPSQEELASYFQANREKFRVPAEVAFSHLYFSTSKRGPNAASDANAALAAFSAARISSSKFAGLGDPFMLQNEYPLQTEQQIKELFGSKFAAKLFQLEPGKWAGPLRSGYGYHLVFIQQKLPSRIPELAEVGNQVLTQFKNERMQAASDVFYAQLRKRYRVEIDKTALAAAGSKPVQHVGDGTTSESAADLD
jgi:peptidyl-prolyl cis-trans isomerase C